MTKHEKMSTTTKAILGVGLTLLAVTAFSGAASAAAIETAISSGTVAECNGNIDVGCNCPDAPNNFSCKPNQFCEIYYDIGSGSSCILG